MKITAEQIKELREITGIGMMECKKALEETAGDMDLAIEELRKKGLAKAAKKADRETFEWGIEIKIEWNKAYIVSVLCETDFLANTDNFKWMLKKVVEFLKENWENSREAAQNFINENYALEMGENLQLSAYKIVEGDVLAPYIHSNGKLASLVIANSGVDADKAKQVAMHVVATNPDFLRAEDISEDVLEKEKQIQLEIMKNDPKMAGKPDDTLLKIIEWKMGKFKAEISLLEQEFVVDPSKKVKDFIGQDSLVAFFRFKV